MRYALCACIKRPIGADLTSFTGPCVVTGKLTTAVVSNSGIAAYESGALMQEAFPELPSATREFLISGISADGWEQSFGPEPEED